MTSSRSTITCAGLLLLSIALSSDLIKAQELGFGAASSASEGGYEGAEGAGSLGSFTDGLGEGFASFLGGGSAGSAGGAGGAGGASSASSAGGIGTVGGLAKKLGSSFGSSSAASGSAVNNRLGAGESESVETTGAGSTGVASSGSAEKEVDYFKHPEELVRILLNPVELIKFISVKYKLHFAKFVKAIGKPLVFGIEAALTPFTITIKVIEKVFVPDTCRLNFVCQLGSKLNFLKEHVSKFSPTFGEGSSLIRAFGDGICGVDCSAKFPCRSGEPKLRKEYEGLRRI